MDAVMGTAEFDPYVANTRSTRVRFDVAYAGSWLLLGWIMAKDGIRDSLAGRPHTADRANR
jgi:hypothetical protein